MPRITKVYTRTGDDGTTALVGGQRVPKDNLRVAAYGSVDETNSHLGVALAVGVAEMLLEPLQRIQNDLFHLGSDLAILEEDKQRFQVPRMEERHVLFLEEFMDELSDDLDPLENFILPGGCPSAAHLHVARAVCRRAERDVIRLSHEEAIGTYTVRYLNRLSDALFVAARYENVVRGVDDVLWDSYA
ncbi:MAG: cob(I)yrinic acid a,c-diamide adenosyltransferase [Acidobacteriota bacterium]